MYKLAENRTDDMALGTEYFIDTPNGRMSVKMPNFVNPAEQQRRLKVIVEALNASAHNIGR